MSFTQIDGAMLRSLQAEGARVVDVRTDAEVARGVIPGAQQIALHTLAARLGELDPATPLILYCQMGGRSAQAAQWLAGKGFARLYNLQGGINAWVAAGGEVAPLG